MWFLSSDEPGLPWPWDVRMQRADSGGGCPGSLWEDRLIHSHDVPISSTEEVFSVQLVRGKRMWKLFGDMVLLSPQRRWQVGNRDRGVALDRNI